MIKSSDISVVVQGNVEKTTSQCLKSIRKFLPDSEIILSTWENCDVSGLDYDILVKNVDPQGFIFSRKFNKLNNLNRIIISSKTGVNAANRKYTLHLRSDLIVQNSNLLKFYDKYSNRAMKYSLFEKRIFVYEMFSLRYEEKFNKKYYAIFHISDWCHLGLTKDIKKLFDIQLVNGFEFSNFFDKKTINDKDIWPERLWKMSPEQYISSENCKKILKNLDIQSRLDWRDEVLETSDAFIVNNFIVKSIDDWGIINSKNEYKGRTIIDSPVTKNGAWLGENWHRAYKKYCDPHYILPLKYQWKEKLNVCRYIEKFRKHCNNFILPIKAFLRKLHKFIEWFLEPLSILYYLLKIVFKILTRFHRLFKD